MKLMNSDELNELVDAINWYLSPEVAILIELRNLRWWQLRRRRELKKALKQQREELREHGSATLQFKASQDASNWRYSLVTARETSDTKRTDEGP